MAFFQTNNLWIETQGPFANLLLNIPGKAANFLSLKVLDDLMTALDRVEAESQFQVLVIKSDKPGNFCSGLDYEEFSSQRPPEHVETLARRGQEVLDRLEKSRLKTSARISGACLGAGLELALACGGRTAEDSPEVQFGFPEFEFGLMPAWGGIQRLPLVVGLERAMKLLFAGRRLGAKEAVRWGLIDFLHPKDDPGQMPATRPHVPRTKLPLATWRQKILESNPLGHRLLFRGARRLIERRVPEDLPAPGEALDALRVGMKNGKEAGLERERQGLTLVATSLACRNLLHLYHNRQKIRQDARSAGPEKLPRRLGFVGIGALGSYLATTAVLGGAHVVVREAGDMALGYAMLRLMTLLQKASEAGQLPAADLTRRLSQIHGTTAWKGFDDLDLIIEAIPDDFDIKKNLLAEVEANSSPGTLLVSTTSTLQIGQLQEGLKHPERFAGLHFPRPIQRTPLVEVIPGPATRDKVLAALARWVTALGKTPVTIPDQPGFLVQRVLLPYWNEAVQLVTEGVPLNLIDETMERFGMPQGPLEQMDLIGLETVSRLAARLEPESPDWPNLGALLGDLVAQGWRGLAGKTGFYHYKGKKPRPNAAIPSVLRQDTAAPLVAPGPPEKLKAGARQRLVLVLVNEAARCFGEKLTVDADTLDLALTLGGAWAPHRGGPLTYARQQGLSGLLSEMEILADYLGPRFTPCPALKHLASS